MDPNLQSRLVEHLKGAIPGLLAAYAFGSRVRGEAWAESDLDLAVLGSGRLDPVLLFETAGDLASLAGCEVDLLDLRAASTVMQHQVITTGERWWAHGVQQGLFEAMVLSEKVDLDARRRGLLGDICREGRIHGR